MRSCEEMVRAIAARSEKFRFGSCETESMIEIVDDFDPPKGREEEWHKALDYYDQHPIGTDGKAYFLEEFDGKMWLTIGFGTGGRPLGRQCEEILKQIMKETYTCSCSSGFRNWSSLPKAKSLEELDLKLSAMGI